MLNSGSIAFEEMNDGGKQDHRTAIHVCMTAVPST
jgi:hypothetical protein